MESKDKTKIKLGLIGVAAAVILAGIVVGAVFVRKYSPSKKYMDGYEYFNVDNTSDSALIIINGSKYEDKGMKLDGKWYLPVDFVSENINVRFYNDAESGAVLYTDDKRTYEYAPGKDYYTDNENNSYKTEYPIAVMVNDDKYVAWEYVAQYTNCTYSYGSAPERICIRSIAGEEKAVVADKDTYVRYRGGIKSDVLEKAAKGSMLYYVDDLDDWIKVTTSTGYTGYVRSKDVSDVYEYVPEDTYVEDYAKVLSDSKIRLGWFQTGGISGNSNAAGLVSTSGVNVISPTWYSVTSEQGDVSSYAQGAWVNDMHADGIKVWPLINDFNKDIDYKTLFSVRSNRRKLIDTLMRDAVSYGYDGINLDFENIRNEYSKDFLQFIRELALECHKNNIVLSTDNYKPEAYNKFYNLKEQSSYVDYVVVMAYDEHYAGSKESGSVSSLPFVENGVDKGLQYIPAERTVVALPFYTRLWKEVKSGDGVAVTSSAYGMSSAESVLQSNSATPKWDEETSQYDAEFKADGAKYKIWLEEETSLSKKMETVMAKNVAGIAFWKLGFERMATWTTIEKYVK